MNQLIKLVRELKLGKIIIASLILPLTIIFFTYLDYKNVINIFYGNPNICGSFAELELNMSHSCASYYDFLFSGIFEIPIIILVTFILSLLISSIYYKVYKLSAFIFIITLLVIFSIL